MIPCITTWTGRRGCRVLGEHLSTCLGIELRGSVAAECSGCLPQPATRGLLCESCHQRVEAALDLAVDLVTHMRSIERAATPQEGPRSPTKPGSQVILPASWQEADRVWLHLRELAFRCDPLEFLEVDTRGTTAWAFGSRDTIEHVGDRVALAVDLARLGDLSHQRIAELAVDFYRAVQRALHAFPIEEYARRLEYVRCRECEMFTLERRQPLEYLDPITVSCVNPACGVVWDPFAVELDLVAYRARLEAERSGEDVSAEAVDEAVRSARARASRDELARLKDLKGVHA